MTPGFIGYAFETAALGDLVRSAWGQSYAASPDRLPGLVAPDAHVEVVFQLGAPCDVISGGRQHASPRAMIYALRHGALQLRPTGANSMVAFRLSPAVASVVLRSGLADCWDRPVSLSDLIGPEADELFDRIAGTPLDQVGPLLEAWLSARLCDWSSDHARQLRLQSALLWEVTGEPLSALAEHMGFTTRTLRRHCHTHAGLSPKQLVMSGRMLRACDLLRTAPVTPLVDVAHRLGFSDQSAFTNAFHHYLGMTPAQLRGQPLVFYEPPR